MPSRNILRFSAISGLFIVVFGALTAHVLGTTWDASQRRIVDTGLFFQAFHTVVLMVLGLLTTQQSVRYLKYTSLLLILGTVLFSGSLYYFAIFQQHATVYLTPFGGILLMAGWLVLIAGSFVQRHQVTTDE